MTSNVQLHSVFLQSMPRSIHRPGNCYASMNSFLLMRCIKIKLSANSSERQGGRHLQQVQKKNPKKTDFPQKSVSEYDGAVHLQRAAQHYSRGLVQ